MKKIITVLTAILFTALSVYAIPELLKSKTDDVIIDGNTGVDIKIDGVSKFTFDGSGNITMVGNITTPSGTFDGRDVGNDGSKLDTVAQDAEDTTNDSWSGTGDISMTSGDVGIGTATPTHRLHLHITSANPQEIHFTNTNSGALVSDGLTVGIDGTGDAIINQKEARKLELQTSGSSRLSISGVGQLTANSIHNNASGASGTTPMIASGTYSPSMGAITNITTVIHSGNAQYIRVGNVVTVSGRVDLDAVTGSGTTTFDMTLPIASALSSAGDAAGSASSFFDTNFHILADTAGNEARFNTTVTKSGSADNVYYTFTYIVK